MCKSILLDGPTEFTFASRDKKRRQIQNIFDLQKTKYRHRGNLNSSHPCKYRIKTDVCPMRELSLPPNVFSLPSIPTIDPSESQQWCFTKVLVCKILIYLIFTPFMLMYVFVLTYLLNDIYIFCLNIPTNFYQFVMQYHYIKLVCLRPYGLVSNSKNRVCDKLNSIYFHCFFLSKKMLFLYVVSWRYFSANFIY